MTATKHITNATQLILYETKATEHFNDHAHDKKADLYHATVT